MAVSNYRLALTIGAFFALIGSLTSTVMAADGVGEAGVVGVPSAASASLVEMVLFYIIALIAVVSALGVCISRNIVRMAVWLFGALAAVALLYILLAATFLGVIQLIVYVGGTLILLVFGVMLTSKSPWVKFEPRKGEIAAAFVVCAALTVCLCAVLARTTWAGTESVVPGAAVIDIGRRLLTTYVVPFEAAGVLLFIVMVGAAHLARQQK